MSGTLGDTAFPPLPVVPASNQQSSPDVHSKKTMAAHLRRQNNKKVNVLNSAPAWKTANRTPAQPVSSSQAWPSINAVSASASSSAQSRPIQEIGSVSSSHSTSGQIRPPSVATSSFAGSLMSSRASGSTNRLSHSSSAPNLSERESIEPSSIDFPPVSVAKVHKPTTSEKALEKVEDVQTANKSLVEKMRIALGFDEEKFTAFKDISGEYRKGSMDAETYLDCVDQFGLSHLVLDLARLLPNAHKQKELIEAFDLHKAYKASRENGWSNGLKDVNSTKKGKGKGKSVDSADGTVKNNIADNVISTVRELQSSYKTSEEVEVLSKDGYRDARGKSKVMVESSGRGGELIKAKGHIESLSAGGGTNQNSGNGDGKGKQRKKTSKFHRVRLGDGSVEALLDFRNTDPDPDTGPNPDEGNSQGLNNPTGSLAARGVWRNSGGQKLLSMKSRGSKN